MGNLAIINTGSGVGDIVINIIIYILMAIVIGLSIYLLIFLIMSIIDMIKRKMLKGKVNLKEEKNNIRSKEDEEIEGITKRLEFLEFVYRCPEGVSFGTSVIRLESDGYFVGEYARRYLIKFAYDNKIKKIVYREDIFSKNEPLTKGKEKECVIKNTKCYLIIRDGFGDYFKINKADATVMNVNDLIGE